MTEQEDYIPDHGHLVWLDFDLRGKMVCVPLTTNARPNWPFMVEITGGGKQSICHFRPVALCRLARAQGAFSAPRRAG